MGTVALFRMGKRVPVVEHHFCQHGAPRCGHGRGLAVFRPLRRARTAAPWPVWAPGELAQPTELAGPARVLAEIAISAPNAQVPHRPEHFFARCEIKSTGRVLRRSEGGYPHQIDPSASNEPVSHTRLAR